MCIILHKIQYINFIYCHCGVLQLFCGIKQYYHIVEKSLFAALNFISDISPVSYNIVTDLVY
jgi:hypothetical protein